MKDINYKEVAFDMMYKGSDNQKRWIEFYISYDKTEEELMDDIKEFIDRAIELGEYEI